MRLVLSLVTALVACLFIGCVPAKSPTDALKTAVVLAAEAVEQADHACAAIGKERKDIALLTACKDNYNIARPALVAAQYYIDLGDNQGLTKSLCTGVAALSNTASVVAAAGGKVPPLVTEAISFSGSLCRA